MRRAVLLSVITIAFAAAAPTAGATAQDTTKAEEAAKEREIVVTGRSLKDTAEVLAACLARTCPPDQDVAATLAHAENLFISGNYDDARSTLLRSVSRNKKHGKSYPVPVSDLLRANGRISEHMGEAKSYQTSVLDMRDTLKKGLGDNDPRTLVAQVEVGDSRAKLGYPFEAERIYEDVQKRAIALGHPRVAMYARLRVAILKYALAEELDDPSARKAGRARLEDIIKNPLPGAADFSLAARVMLARADRKEGRTGSTEDIVREFASSGGATRPVLLFSEPIERFDLSGDPSGGEGSNVSLNRLTLTDVGDRWVDIGFWVNPDGRVADIEVLRGQGPRDWLKPVIAHLNSRTYAPLKKDGNDAAPGFYLIERYTMTARWQDDTTGTRMRRREVTPRIERLDITPEDYAPPTQIADAGPK